MSSATSRAAPAAVTVTAVPLWRVRLVRDLPRYLLRALAVCGLLASARFAIDPPRPVAVRQTGAPGELPDPAEEGFASLFARDYLSWNARDPEARVQQLAPFVGSTLEAGAGLQPPAEGSQQVQWTQVVQARAPAPGEHVYTIAVQTDLQGLLYLSVGVAREPGGRLALTGYPALVGGPAVTGALSGPRLREVEEPALATVVTRALRNYLADDESELDADLVEGAQVALPGIALSLQAVQSLQWHVYGHAVLAVVQARERLGAQYTLAYELDVSEIAGRWEIAQIQTDPNS